MTQPAPVEALTAWNGHALGEEEWLLPLPPDFPHAPDGHPSDTGPAEAALAGLAARVTQRLRAGRGFVVIRGFPVAGRTDRERAATCRRLAASLGAVRPEDPGDLVTVTGGAGLGKTDLALALHTDRTPAPHPPRVLGLLCVRPAAHGGETLLASGHTVHNRLLAESPWALPRLYQDFHFGRGAGFDRHRPVFRRHGADLRVHYNRRGIERAHHAAGAPLSPDDRAALDAVDRILSDPRTVLRVPLRRGDLLWLDNAVVLHGRTAFTDSPDPHARRCLVRVWVDCDAPPATPGSAPTH
ncbi:MULTISPECIES: TauD/TfdA family dioxygenase [Streptomyces]|uniref:TauD/TfdA family dioxygenase n=1 Tax=Streptomyces TaxID=1883 RepID=UPI00163C14FF|nr:MULTISPECIES: TauD/TfdA family dioxygenase [Streptomyces]MBC2874201.1 TauD/TfdA family dioxygenase [Streptomyces sp. TYQ1024]UBI40243.1 TauD/TfdA family dioxygenase [Streptomyces mobaraensis]UKW32821.1 TauD/TfdA family dioxygenase [Streptomyces sp. TYQ1024]